uniref:glycoside hydrolase family 3 N-terminal domain-containing protein n=1 Tax=Acetatifactor sp. TaxID=1872090 RepID=UPI004056F6F0
MNLNEQEKREARRKRRQRNQIIAYVTVILLIILMAVGIVFGVSRLTQAAQEQEEVQQDMVDALIGTEETIVVPIQTQEPTEEEVVVELTPEQKLDEIVNAGIEVMPLEDKVAGLFIVTPEAITGVSTAIKAGDGTREALAEYAVGGIIYFSKNIQSEEQLKEMIDNTQLYTKYPLLIAVAEEGGSVAHVADEGVGTKVDSAQTIGETGDTNNAYQAGNIIGTYLSELGFNLDFAPVADISSVEGHSLGSRTYGSDAASVAPFVTSMMQGLEDMNVTACLKHFPGNGSSTQDTHDGMATTDRTLEEFRANEFVVFKAGIDAGANMIMVGHLSAPALTGDNTPCSMSSAVVTDILRNEMNFDGVIISDAMNMSAISEYYGSDEAAIMALRAGCDMILMPEDFELAYNGVLQAVQDGTISEERINDSLRRIYRIKYADKIQE